MPEALPRSAEPQSHMKNGWPKHQTCSSKHPRRDSAKPECLPRGAEASAKPHVEKPVVVRSGGLKAARGGQRKSSSAG